VASKKEKENLKIKKRLDRCIKYESDNRKLALADIHFRNGDQWDEAVKTSREQDKRPCLTFNRCEGFIDQVTGDNRQNKVDIKITAVDSSPLAPLYEGIIQQIEYKSKATIAYNTALDNAAGNGFGYIRVNTKYIEGTFDQECEIRRVPNPFTVYLDPDAKELTKWDMKYAFVSGHLDKEDFKKKYPNAGSEPPQGDGESWENWYGDKVRIVEYFEIKETEYELCLLDDNTIVPFSKDIPKERIKRKRTDTKREVYRSLRSGMDELEKPKKIPGKYIPIIPVYGKELNIEGKTTYRGVIRHAKDAMQAYNYHRTASAEIVGTAPRAPWLATADQIEGYEDIWSTANTKNHSYLPYNHKVGQPMPQRVQPSGVPTGTVNEAMMAVEDLKATTGLYDASLGAKGNETSGKAILARQSQGDNATFAYHDNLAIAIEQVGRVLVGMIPEVYDSSRIIKAGMGDKEQAVPINTPLDDGGVMNDLKQGTYEVAVKTGASYATQRVEALDAMMQLTQIMTPQERSLMMDKVFENMDWKGSDEMAQRLKTLVPKQVLDPNSKPEPNPEQQAKMAEAKADIAKAKAEEAKAQATIAKAKADIAQANEDVEQLLDLVRNEILKYHSETRQ